MRDTRTRNFSAIAVLLFFTPTAIDAVAAQSPNDTSTASAAVPSATHPSGEATAVTTTMPYSSKHNYFDDRLRWDAPIKAWSFDRLMSGGDADYCIPPGLAVIVVSPHQFVSDGHEMASTEYLGVMPAPGRVLFGWIGGRSLLDEEKFIDKHADACASIGFAKVPEIEPDARLFIPIDDGVTAKGW